MSIHRLPFDVLDSLCIFLDTHDLKALALASSAFTLSATKRLFRSLTLDSQEQAERCLPILARRHDLARHARSFSLRLDPAATLSHEFVRLLAHALRNMPLLSSLDLALPPSASSAFVAPSTTTDDNGPVYERLRHFSCNLPLDASICNFLGRTPSVSELHLGEHQTPTHAPASDLAASSSSTSTQHPHPQQPAFTFPPTALPNLSVFWGPPDVAAALVPGRPLESVHVYYGQLSSRVADALARSTAPIGIFCAFTQSLSPAILRQLAQSLPHVRHLRIMTMYHAASTQPDEAFYGQVVQILSDLPQLVTAELAGFRWACPKEPIASTSIGANSSGNSTSKARRKPEPARAHAPTPPSEASDAVAAQFNDYAHY